MQGLGYILIEFKLLMGGNVAKWMMMDQSLIHGFMMKLEVTKIMQ
jgi:hypothetical protein